MPSSPPLPEPGSPDDPDRWRRADRLFDRALDLPPGERPAFLAEACGGDAALRTLVERLLAADAAAEAAETDDAADGSPRDHRWDALWDGLDEELATGDDALGPGALVDRYRILQEVGRGGMGVVYRAARADGAFEAEVALKVIRRGRDTTEVLARFARERQILASLSHPGIARLLDGGTLDAGSLGTGPTGAGLPYFVLEFVEGRPIDRYADGERLTVEERLALFREVAQAVAHAHANLVVHRDLKPSNILVTGDGRVQLLDFGIAKVLETSGQGGLGVTRTGSRIMTPAYASPEQVRGEPVTTASDLYQLGLLLYRLLTGRWPYPDGLDLGPSSPASEGELVRAIAELEPRRASTAVRAAGHAAAPEAAEIAALRRTTPARLARRLRGDLDNILRKTLQKDPARRYGSVAQLIEDLDRHRAGRPVSARPDRLGYRLAAFARRHRAAVATAAGVALLLVTLITFYTLRLAQERDRAELSAERAGEVSAFLTELFRVSAPTRSRGEEITARQLLARGSAWMAELEGQPELRASMGTILGDIHRELALYDEARPLLESTVADLRRMPGERPLELAAALHALARLDEETADFDGAQAAAREALALLEGALGSRDLRLAPVLRTLGSAQHASGRSEEGRASLERALEIQRRHLPPGHPEVGLTLERLGTLAFDSFDFEGARGHLDQAVAILTETHGPDHPLSVGAAIHLARVLDVQGERAAAEAQYRLALPRVERAWGAGHPEVAVVLVELADLAADDGRWDEALGLYDRALALRVAAFGRRHPEVAAILNDLGRLEEDRGNPDAARTHYRESAEIVRATHGEDHLRLSMPLNNLAHLERDQGRPREARRLYLEVLAIREAAQGEHPILIEPLHHLARLDLAEGDPRAAEPRLRRALALAEAHGAGEHGSAFSRLELARSLILLGRLDEAEEHLVRVEGLPEPHPELARRTAAVRSLLAEHRP